MCVWRWVKPGVFIVLLAHICVHWMFAFHILTVAQCTVTRLAQPNNCKQFQPFFHYTMRNTKTNFVPFENPQHVAISTYKIKYIFEKRDHIVFQKWQPRYGKIVCLQRSRFWQMVHWGAMGLNPHGDRYLPIYALNALHNSSSNWPCIFYICA